MPKICRSGDSEQTSAMAADLKMASTLYADIVKAIKQQGKRVVCVFFERAGLSPELKLAADDYYDLTGAFQKSWQTLLKPIS